MRLLGFTCAFCLAIACLLSSEQVLAKSTRATQRASVLRLRASMAHWSNAQLFQKIDHCEKELSALFPQFIDARSQAYAAAARFTTGGVYEISSASPYYRKLWAEYLRHRNRAMGLGMRMQAISNQKWILEMEVRRRLAGNRRP